MRKKFFKEPTAAEIRKKDFKKEIYDDIAKNVLDLKDNEYVIIKVDLIPEEFKDDPRKFMKHGSIVNIPRYRSLEDALEYKKTPVQLREIPFNKLSKKRVYCGYTFKPFIGTDKRTRKVSLVEDLRGSKLYMYAHQDASITIDVKPYDDAKRVEREGAEIIVSVPSRTEKRSRYEFKFSSVPVEDNELKWGIAYNILTNHSCKSKTFNIKYGWVDQKESSKEFNFCAHEIAGYLSIIDYYNDVEKNIIPIQMSQFVIPSRLFFGYYNKLNKNCLIQTEDDKKPRRLIMREQEVCLFDCVKLLGCDRTLYAKKSRDGLLKDYEC